MSADYAAKYRTISDICKRKLSYCITHWISLHIEHFLWVLEHYSLVEVLGDATPPWQWRRSYIQNALVWHAVGGIHIKNYIMSEELVKCFFVICVSIWKHIVYCKSRSNVTVLNHHNSYSIRMLLKFFSACTKSLESDALPSQKLNHIVDKR